MTSAKEYWENRILAWDADIYGERDDTRSRFLSWSRNPPEAVQFRFQTVLKHLAPYVQGKRVLEFSCGTGQLCGELINLGAKTYRGIDISMAAIEKAKERNASQNTSFECADLITLTTIDADLVVSTGLMTWISTAQIHHLFNIGGKTNFYHTVSEPRLSIRQMIRRIYDFRDTKKDYKAQLKKTADIEAIAKQYGWNKTSIYRHKKLHSVACISSLPL
ncbi:MAG: class I SAM-dependent methyltransferase [Rhodospirillales bacterium]